MVRLSELRGVLYTLEQFAHKKGNFDPIVELFHQDGNTVELNVDIKAINKDPEGQLTMHGSIHLPLKEIVTRGFIVTYINGNKEDCITIQAESRQDAMKLFAKHFCTYTLKCVSEEI